jgi:hypothetical protein
MILYELISILICKLTKKVIKIKEINMIKNQNSSQKKVEEIEAIVVKIKKEDGKIAKTLKEVNDLFRNMKDDFKNEEFLNELKEKYGEDMKFSIPDPSKDIKLGIKFDSNTKETNYIEPTIFLPNTQDLVKWIENNFWQDQVNNNSSQNASTFKQVDGYAENQKQYIQSNVESVGITGKSANYDANHDDNTCD